MTVSFTAFIKTLFPWVVSACLLGSIFYLSLSPYFRVTEIQCYLDQANACLPPIYQWLTSNYNRKIFFLDTWQIEQAVLHEFPYLLEAHVSVTLPRTLSLTLTSAPPGALIKINQSTYPVAVTLTGYQTPKASSEPLPELSVAYPLSWSKEAFTKPFPGEIVASVQFLNLLKKSQLNYVKVELSDPDTLVMTLNHGLTILMNPTSDHQFKLATLQAILSASTINPEVKVIDVRFNKPVLKKEAYDPTQISSESSSLKE